MKAQDLDIDFYHVLSTAQRFTHNEWEKNFVGDLEDKYDEYGEDMYVSDKQVTTLMTIFHRSKR
jgi:hypothetical protein